MFLALDKQGKLYFVYMDPFIELLTDIDKVDAYKTQEKLNYRFCLHPGIPRPLSIQT